MLALAADVAIILTLAITTAITVSLHDEKIRKSFLVTVVTIGKHISDSNRHQIQQFILSIVSFVEVITRFFTGQQKSVSAERKDTYVSVPMKFMGKDYHLLVPYDSKLARDMPSYFTILDGKKKEFEHPPGIPLLVTAKDLGVDEIITETVDEVSF